MTEFAVVSTRPPCDMCLVYEAVYDGKTVAGPWAYMCEPCWLAFGVGRLGIGFGQKLIPHGEVS